MWYAVAGWVHAWRPSRLSAIATGGEEELQHPQREAGDLHAAGDTKEAAFKYE